MVSVDGFVEGNNQDIHWHLWDEEMGEYMMEFFKTIDAFIYGRVSYELMLKYWPSETGEFADIMNKTPKLVFSKTLDKVAWNGRVINEVVPEEMKALKQLSGKDMVLFAGADLASTFIQYDLIDEYRLIVNPIVLGSGTPFFKDQKEYLHLKLVEIKPFSCGNVLLVYQREVDSTG